MSSAGDGEPDASRRSIKNIKGLWRDAVRTLKTSNSSSEDDTRSVSCSKIATENS